jgi:hypothetical protein
MCHTELHPNAKKIVSFQILKGFEGTIFWGGRFLKPKSSKFERFHSFCIIKEIIGILNLLMKSILVILYMIKIAEAWN